MRKRTNPEYFFNPETKVNFNPELSSTPIRNCEFGFWETLLFPTLGLHTGKVLLLGICFSRHIVIFHFCGLFCSPSPWDICVRACVRACCVSAVLTSLL